MLSDGVVGIRPFQSEDGSRLYHAARESIDELCRWMSWCGPDYSLTDSVAFVHEAARAFSMRERFSFAIVDEATQIFLGSIGLREIDRTHRVANLGYWVRSSWMNRGVGSAAVRLAARFAFEELELNRLELVVVSGNIPSERVAVKVGAHREGVLRRRVVLQGKPHDVVMMSLLPEDLERGEVRVGEPVVLAGETV